MMIPFFVADRPMSLRILKGLPLEKYPEVKIGIMAHANTSPRFQQAFRDYPCEDLERCDAIGGKPCQYRDKYDKCPHQKLITDRTVKMCDSGVFTREGAMLSYDQLFATYEQMNVKYGIMIDVLQDAEKTIESAKQAKKVYSRSKYNFELVVVAQGKTIDEYLDCYQELKNLGFKHIAVGGLLRRQQNTVRYVKVGSEQFLFEVLNQLRDKYNPDWLFALGCLSPTRVERLNQLNVNADYKGWIFKYKKRNESLTQYLQNFSNQHFDDLPQSAQNLINQRTSCVEEQKNLTQELCQNKKKLRELINNLHQNLQNLGKNFSDLAKNIQNLTTRGLISKKEIDLVKEAFTSLNQENEDLKHILDYFQKNREITNNIKVIEKQLNQINISLGKFIKESFKNSTPIKKNTKNLCDKIQQIIDITEQDYRLKQVREMISDKILQKLIKLD